MLSDRYPLYLKNEMEYVWRRKRQDNEEKKEEEEKEEEQKEFTEMANPLSSLYRTQPSENQSALLS